MTTGNAGKAVNEYIYELLSQCLVVKSEDDEGIMYSEEHHDLRHLLEDIKCKICTCVNFEPEAPIFYQISSSHMLKIPSNIRIDALQVLFQVFNDDMSVTEAVMKSILKVFLI